MKTFEERLEQAKAAIEHADCVLLGAGAGLSDAAGLTYSGKRFEDNFADFIKRYGMTDMYSSAFYPFQTEEERWAYWARHIAVNRYNTPAAALYKELLRLLADKDYFVITTNVEHQFYKAGFSADKVFAVQGDYGYLQCAKACHGTLYDNEALVRELLASTHGCRIQTALIPKCPVCGGRMEVNLRKDNHFVEDENWRLALERCSDFVKEHSGKRIVFLELGVGYNTPGIIRFPFEQMTYANPSATLIRINRDYPHGAKENAKRTVSFDENMAEVIQAL